MVAPPPVWPEMRSPAFKRMAGERAQPWLEARGRNATGLIAMWDLTGDEALLKEAAERFPNDPRVCMAMIAMNSGKASAALPWIERLIAAEPKNPHGYHLKAWALMAAKSPAEALAALTQAAGSASPRNNHAAERARTVREAALAAGMSAGHAARIAIGTPFDRMTDCRVGGSVNRVILDEGAKAKAAGDETRLMEITGLGLTIAESMRGGTLVLDRFAAQLEQRLLEELPDDTEIGEGGRTAGALRAEILERQAYIKQASGHLSEVEENLRTASDEVAAGYADCFLGHGERKAVRSLRERLQELELNEGDAAIP
jgi:tetratricopeptide (TPR) repeat protein